MKIEIYSQEDVKEEPLRLALRQWGVGTITLHCVDEFGETLSGGNLLSINSEGKLLRSSSINPDLGFELDSNGRLYVGE